MERRDVPIGLVHGDLFFDNVLVRGEEVEAIIDFEDSCRHPLVYDLGMAIVGLCSRGEAVSLAGARALVEGYQEGRRLSEAEKNALQAFVEAAAIGTSVWRFWKYRVQADVADRAERHWEMARIAESVASVPAGLFRQTVFEESTARISS